MEPLVFQKTSVAFKTIIIYLCNDDVICIDLNIKDQTHIKLLI